MRISLFSIAIISCRCFSRNGTPRLLRSGNAFVILMREVLDDMKRFFCMLLMLFLPVCTAHAEELHLAIASDLHYLSPELIDDEAALMRIIRAADGKLTHYTPQIVQAFRDELLQSRPDAVVLSGDLTLNGSNESHRDMMALLQPLQQAGIPVLVIPGNHDSTGTAFRFTHAGALEHDGMEDDEFITAYADFGYNSALSRDSVSFSYTYALRPDVWLLLLDVNANHTYGVIRDETLVWLEQQLQAAQEAGALVISITHQNLLVHHPLFVFGYQINNAGKLLELYKQYGVRLNLSGHMHLQHIAEKDGITDIATSALPVWPNQYGWVTITDREIRYDARRTDVAGWAEAQGITDDDLLDFDHYSLTFFDATTRDKLARQLNALDISEEEKQLMLDYAVELNHNIFAGVRPQEEDNAPLALWQQYAPRAFFSYYMKTVTDNPPADMTRCVLPRLP